MKRIRVAYIIPTLTGRGGWATFAAGAIRALTAHVEPVLIVERKDVDTAHEKFPQAEIHSVATIFPEDWSGTSPSLLRRILPSLVAMRRWPPLGVDLVHSLEMFPVGWLGHALARKSRVPHVLTAHGTYAVLWKRWALLDTTYRSVLRSASAICPVSNGTGDRLRTFYGDCLRNTRIRIISNGTDAAARFPREILAGKEWPDHPVVLSVGGLKPRKGYHVSLEAFARLQKQFPDAEYIIVGRGLGTEYHRRLEEIVSRESVENVEFTGAVDDSRLEQCFRRASMFALLSLEEGLHFEGFGLVFLEAGAFGLPVIGARTGGIPDVVGDGRNGILVPEGESQAAAEAMIRLAEDPGLSRRLGAAGRERAEHLTWDRFAAEQASVYREVLAG